MGEKKQLRRDFAALQHEAAVLSRQIAALTAERDLLGDALLDAGLLRIGTPRSAADRRRAAEAGVIVLEDIYPVAPPQFTVENEAVHSIYGGDIPGKTHRIIELKFETDHVVFTALQTHMQNSRRL